MKKIVPYLVVLVLLSSCNAYKGINVQPLSNGMSKQQVEDVIDRKLTLVSSTLESDVKKEVYQAQKRIVRGGIARQQRYNFYIIDGKLVRYELADEKFSF
jgi:hypothetical protein